MWLRPCLQARVGYSPSFTWRSIMAAQALMRDGLRWRIGDGRKTEIWRDRWLATAEEDSFKITSPQCHIGETSTVVELIDHNTRSWKSKGPPFLNSQHKMSRCGVLKRVVFTLLKQLITFGIRREQSRRYIGEKWR
ncbi:unnamed protein product [Linum trigynum]|uniref:Uncharacterized protein n=1 Tax=Linum trigynum TaxID=586398 RepID=A0AAV2DHC1_9ROSI